MCRKKTKKKVYELILFIIIVTIEIKIRMFYKVKGEKYHKKKN